MMMIMVVMMMIMILMDKITMIMNIEAIKTNDNTVLKPSEK